MGGSSFELTIRQDHVLVERPQHYEVVLGEQIANARVRIAIVEGHDAPDKDVELLENVAWNRGGLIRFFDSKTAAEDWLEIS